MATQSTISGSGYGNTYVDSLVWGCKWTGSPITYSFGSGYMPGYQPTAANLGNAWSQAELDAFSTALQLYSNVANLSFSQVTFNNSLTTPNADIVFYQVPEQFFGLGSGALGMFEVPDGKSRVNFGYFNYQDVSWSDLNQGSYGFVTVVHELGHGLGLAHPHDGGGGADATTFPGVTSSRSTGTYALNQGIWTSMTYIDGWTGEPSKGSNSYGWEATPMAFDIAALQAIYGANLSYNTGNNTYVLPSVNAPGTYWNCIWDAGGTDVISNEGSSVSCTIDLRPAPLIGQNAGGYVSWGAGIVGGFTIANGVLVENAAGGSGNDTIYGNAANNLLVGGSGNDIAVFSGTFAGASISYSSNTNVYTVVTAMGGVDTVSSIEFFQFDDQSVASSALASAATPDTTAPTVSSFSPADGALDVATVSNIELTFSEAIQRGTGSVVLQDAAGTIIETFDAATSNRLSISGMTLLLDPTNLLNASTQYSVVFASGTISDLAGNIYTGTSAYDFTTAAAEPAGDSSTTATLAVDSPVGGNIGAVGDHDWFRVDLVAGVTYRFDLAATAGSSLDAYLGLRDSNGLQLAFDDDSGVGTDSLLVYTPILTGIYYLDAGGFHNTSTGNYTLGVSIPSLFDTIAPAVTGFTPADGALNVATSSNIELTFSEAIQRGTGDIVLQNAAGTIIETFNVATSTRLSISGMSLLLDPTSLLDAGTQYSVVFASGTITDVAGNVYAGTSAYDFTTAVAEPAGDLSTTATLAVGSTVNGNIGAGGDHDWFRVDLVAGMMYRFDLVATLDFNLDSFLRLRDSNGVLLSSDDDSGLYTDSLLVYIPTLSGTYYLDAGGYNDISIGNYTLGVAVSVLGAPVFGTAAADVMIGTVADDSLNGLAGNDDIDGGIGADYMVGGFGDDYFTVDNVADQVVEFAREGLDTVWTTLNSYTLGANVEDLVFFGVGSFSGDGNTQDNYIEGDVGNDLLYGDDGNDALIGLAGNDDLDGGIGADYMEGGLGDDYYFVDNVADQIFEVAGEGLDAVWATLNSYVLDGNVEDLVFYGDGDFTGDGNALDNYIEGDIGNDVLNGLVGNDILVGLAGNDILDGGTGIDTMVGAQGDDVYVVDNAGDVVTETLGAGIDTVQSSVSCILAVNVENLTLTGMAAISGTGNTLNNLLIGNAAVNILVGGAGNDTLDGGAGADKMNGGIGNDTYVVDHISDTTTEAGTSLTEIDTVQSSISRTLGGNLENLVLTGTAAINGGGNTLNNRMTGNAAANTLNGGGGNDILYGGAGNDTLNGGVGNDTMTGGAGNDTYVVDSVADVTTETSTLLTEIDTVQSSISRALGGNLENLVLTGTAAINGVGNALNNTITGNAAANALNGGAGNDTLDGGAGNDTLNGSTGIDTMTGGTGNDTYVVDSAADVTSETSTLLAEIDTVQSSVTRTLGLNIENLVLTGNAAINGGGNTLKNRMVGNVAANTLNGGGGNDTLSGLAGNDTLNGGAGDDNMVGDVGNDTLDGGTGKDTMNGGLGDDTYLFARLDGGDKITDTGGLDVLTLGANVNFDQLWFQHVANTNNLKIAIIGTKDSVTVNNWYLGAANQVEMIQAGGLTLSNANVEALVQAMAAFAPPLAGTQTILPASYQTALSPVVAANWV